MKNLKKFAAIEEIKDGRGKLPQKGYVLEVKTVEDFSDKEYLKVQYDIAEGEYAGYFKDLEEKYDFWGLTSIHSYKEKAIPFFKRLCSSVNASNPGYTFNPFGGNGDEQTLIGKNVGAVLVEEEYDKNNGEKGTKMVIAYLCDAQKIRSGNYKMPKAKKPSTPADTSMDGFKNIPEGTDEEVPFN